MRQKLMGYTLGISFLMTSGVLAVVIGALAGHFDHESLGLVAAEIRIQVCLELVLLAALSILYSRLIYLPPALVTMFVFNPIHPIRFSFWTWQAIDWLALAFMAFCNLMFFSATQDLAEAEYRAKRSQEELHGSTG